jgi:hypothetical protein
MWACFIVIYVAAGRLLPHWLNWVGAKIGETGYSMYLIHFAVVFVIIKNGFYARPTGNGYYDALVTTLLMALPPTVPDRSPDLPYDRVAIPKVATQVHHRAHNALTKCWRLCANTFKRRHYPYYKIFNLGPRAE